MLVSLSVLHLSPNRPGQDPRDIHKDLSIMLYLEDPHQPSMVDHLGDLIEYVSSDKLDQAPINISSPLHMHQGYKVNTAKNDDKKISVKIYN